MNNENKHLVLIIGYVTLAIVIFILIFVADMKKLYVSIFAIVGLSLMNGIASKYNKEIEEKIINTNSVKSVEQANEFNEDQDSLEEYDEEDEEDFDATDDEVDEEELTEVEEKYKEEVEFLLEDGAIDAEGRKLLERKRVRWEISEERANEIEQMCFSPSLSDTEQESLSDEEKEYIEIYKEISAEGEMTDRKRRMLDRERDLLGISQERAKELETL